MAKKSASLERTTGSLFDSIPKENFQESDAQSGTDAIVSSRISSWAVVSLVFGVLGFFSLVSLGLVCCSAVGIFSAIAAFLVIGRSGGEIGGKKLAAIGLICSLGSAIAGPVKAVVYEREFNKQADQFILAWFEAVKADDPTLARMFDTAYWQRKPLVAHSDSVSYWKNRIGGEDESHFSAHSYLCNPTLLTLNYLGDRVKPSYCRTIRTILSAGTEETNRIYAVTVEPEEAGGKKQTFFLNFVVQRITTKTAEGQKLVGWVLHQGEFVPLKLNAQGAPISDND